MVPGLDVAKFRELARTERFFDLGQLGEGTGFAFNSARFEATIADGEANLETAELIGPQQMFSLSGVIPYSRSSLAIAGVLSPVPVTEGQTEAVQPSAEALRFFIGGSWPQPVISPVIQ
jgi:AsmA protein